MLETTTLARIIDIQGMAAAEPHIARLVIAARRHGINPVAVDVLADTTQPEIARLRALARVQRDLTPPLTPTHAAA